MLQPLRICTMWLDLCDGMLIVQLACATHKTLINKMTSMQEAVKLINQ